MLKGLALTPPVIGQLFTVRDWLRFSVSRFTEAGLAFGHGSDNAYDEAAHLILHTLNLPLDRLEPFLDARLLHSERVVLLDMLNRRVDERIPAAYLTHEAWLGDFSFYVDERVIVPRSFIAELLPEALEPWIEFPELVNDALGPYQGFIKVDQGLLFSDLINALPPHSVVLEILETVAQTPEMIARCEQLRFAGYILAVRERPESLDQNRQLLKLAQVIKIDISRVEPARLQQLVTNLKPLGKTLLAEKVESVEQMKLCHDLGFDLFQGYYFARPTVISGKHLQASELALIRLLGLLSHDANISQNTS